MLTKLQVFVRHVYGRPTFYPYGDNAALIQSLIKKKTLDKRDILTLEALGFEVERVTDPATL
jgi:hypothetical protein